MCILCVSARNDAGINSSMVVIGADFWYNFRNRHDRCIPQGMNTAQRGWKNRSPLPCGRIGIPDRCFPKEGGN
jgi:hypothetical protein